LQKRRRHWVEATITGCWNAKCEFEEMNGTKESWAIAAALVRGLSRLAWIAFGNCMGAFKYEQTNKAHDDDLNIMAGVSLANS
jgi:hypothetical protein